MKLEQIADDVFACLQAPQALGTSNSGLIRRGGGMVVDTFWDLPHTRRLIEEYARVCASPARRVVNTHHNGDHCWGNQLFADAEIIGHRLCADSFGSERPEVMQAIKQAADQDSAIGAFARSLAPWDFSDIELTPPTTLVEDRLTLDLDGTACEILYVGPAHTAGDVIVHLPEHGVVFAGDVLFRLCTPIGWEGTNERWCQALDRIVALNPAVIVPGHGPLCGSEGPIEMKAYLQYVFDESRRFFAAGIDAIAAAQRIDRGPYADWAEPERIVLNVARAYRELRGEPWDTRVDILPLVTAMQALR